MDEIWRSDEDDDLRTRGARRRSAFLVALAVVPWLVVAVVVLRPDRDPPRPGDHDLSATAPIDPHPDRDHGTDEAHDGAEAVSTDDDAAGARGGDLAAVPHPVDPRHDHHVTPWDGGAGSVTEPTDELDVVELRGRWRVEPGPEEAASLAVVVARAWLTGIDPVLKLDGIQPQRDRYAEHLVVEAIEQPGPGASIVTLLAVVLDGEELAPNVRRLAVPITWDDDGPRPAGAPWWLPGPRLELDEPELAEVDDPDVRLAAIDALTAAGYDVTDVRAVWRTGSWPVVVDAAARTPDGDVVDGPVWLRPHQGRYVVGGTTLADVASPMPGFDEEDA